MLLPMQSRANYKRVKKRGTPSQRSSLEDDRDVGKRNQASKLERDFWNRRMNP
jgi:hypothetical protein